MGNGGLCFHIAAELGLVLCGFKFTRQGLCADDFNSHRSVLSLSPACGEDAVSCASVRSSFLQVGLGHSWRPEDVTQDGLEDGTSG